MLAAMVDLGLEFEQPLILGIFLLLVLSKV